MGLPAANAISTAPDEGTLKQYLEDVVAVAKELPGAAAETELTIATGVITVTGAAHSVDTEADAGSDDLTNALNIGVEDGHFLELSLENDARLVAIQHEAGGAGQFSLRYGQDLVLRSTKQFVRFRLDTGATPDTWREIARHGFDCPNEVEAEGTATVGSPRALTALESGKVFTNEGALAKVGFTLPTAAAGLVFTFIVQDTDGIRVVANAGDTIGKVGTVTGAAGNVDSTTQRAVIRMRAINATEWITEIELGTWAYS